MITTATKIGENISESDTASRNPSVALLMIGVIIVILALCVNPAPNNDLYWQLRTGQLIALQHHAPHADTYSWTRSGTPWVAHEWLAFVVMWELYHAAGFPGIWYLLAGLTSATYLVYYRLMVRETGAPIAGFLFTMLVAVLASPFFQPRPQLFTYISVVVLLGIVLSARRAVADPVRFDAERRRLPYLALLFVLWANLHAGVLIGLGLIAAFAAGDSLTAFVRRRDDSGYAASFEYARTIALSKSLGLLAAAGGALTLITPYGYHEYQNFIATVTNNTMLNMLGEWASPNFHDTFGKLTETFLALAFYGLLFTRLRRDYTEIAIVVLLAHEGITANRNVPLLALIGGLLIARHVQSAFRHHVLICRPSANTFIPGHVLSANPRRLTVAVACLLTCVPAVAYAARQLKDVAPASPSLITKIALATVNFGTYPERACRFIVREKFPPSMRMYNIYGQGGFLIWRLPKFPVFIDGRSDIYFGSMLDQVSRMKSLPLDWRSTLDSHKVDLIVTAASEQQARLFLDAPDWALVYVDRPDIDADYIDYPRQINSLIFVKRMPEYAELITRCRRDCPALASGAMDKFGDYASLGDSPR